jgi:hypothetical protein
MDGATWFYVVIGLYILTQSVIRLYELYLTRKGEQS